MKDFDVSKWEGIEGSTKGTRDKELLLNPDTDVTYFLKYSMDKPGKTYTSEYWSEIIASEIGKYFGFNILEYDFAIRGDRAGCISENMIDKEKEELVEGYSILMAYDPTYDPEDKNSYSKYTFSFVCKALEHYNLIKYLKDFVKILIFDSIIGNSDRHQSNWGFIKTTERFKLSPENKKIFYKIFPFLSDRSIKGNIEIKLYRMAPIYDSGCCLGREFNETQIENRLRDKSWVNNFAKKGFAELRSDDDPENKKSHYDLLKKIQESDVSLCQFIETEINRILGIYSKQELENIVMNIDSHLPADIRCKYGLSEVRKQFIIEVIEKRVEYLKQCINVSKS
jgi:hypothetical protein